MMNNFLKAGSRISLYTDQGSAPAIPTAGNGKDISALRDTDGRTAKYQLIELEAGSSAPCTLPGPVKVYIERGSKVRYACTLNQGAAIVLDNPATGAGYEEMVQGIGLGDRIEIVPGGVIASGNFSGGIRGVVGSP